jgi:Methyltransferase domain
LDEDFDLIHARMLNGSIEDWPGIYAKAFKHLKPGGKFEQVEIDFEPHSNNNRLDAVPALVEWYNLLMAAMDQSRRPMRIQRNTTDRLRAAGFADVHEEIIRIPFSPWPLNDDHEQHMARWFNLGLVHGLEGYSLAPFTRNLHKPVEEVRELITRVKREICLLGPQTYCFL